MTEWTSLANPTLQSVRGDLGAVTTAAGFSDAIGVHSNCLDLRADVTKMKQLPAAPDATARSGVAATFSSLGPASDACIAAGYAAASPDLDQGAAALDQLLSYLQTTH